MSDLEKVKPKGADYQWYQDEKFIRIRIPISGTSSKKINVDVTDLVLKINAVEKKFVVMFDLENEVNTESKETRFVYSNGILEVALVKLEQGKQWKDLVIQDLSKEEIKERRQKSFQRQEEKEKEYNKNRQELKWKYDSEQTRQQMKQEDYARQKLQDMKDQEKKKAEEFLFKDYKDNMSKNELTQYVTAKKVENDIFNDRDLMDYERQVKEAGGEIPKPRQSNTINVNFTEKIYPNIATRESHFKDAPMPRSVTKQLQAQGSEVDQKNPLWLKDKADQFYKKNDFYSALNAYSQAFKLDDQFIECVANRSAVYMNLFGYHEAITDCEKVLDFIENLKDQEKKEKYFLLQIKAKLRKCMAETWKGTVDQAAENIKKLVEFLEQKEIQGKVPETIQQQILATSEIIGKRVESIRIKKLGDLQYAEAKYDKAIELYQKSMEIDQNETAMGNISISYLKMKQDKDCIEYCDKCINKIQEITQFANNNPQFRTNSADEQNMFLMKLYLRKSQSQLNLQMVDEGFKTIKRAIQIDERNKEARQIYNELEKKINTQKVLKLKDEAAAKMKEKKISEALEIYNECLKILDTNEVVEYLALLLNRCVCYLHLKQYEDIISSSLRGLKIIRSQKNRVLSWDKQSTSKETREKLTNFEVRFLVRRSNAYVQQNFINNAKADLNEALKLDPNNKQIQEDLNKLNQLKK